MGVLLDDIQLLKMQLQLFHLSLLVLISITEVSPTSSRGISEKIFSMNSENVPDGKQEKIKIFNIQNPKWIDSFGSLQKQPEQASRTDSLSGNKLFDTWLKGIVIIVAAGSVAVCVHAKFLSSEPHIPSSEKESYNEE